MATFVNDTFTGTNGTALTAHTSEGTTWARHSWNASASTPEIQGNALQATATNDEAYFYADNAPAAADYEATTRFVISTVSNANAAAALVRLATGAATGYALYYNSAFGSPILRLYKNVAGTSTALGSNVAASLGVDTYLITLKAVGTALTGRVQRTSDSQWLTSAGAWQAGQVDCVSATDGSITAAGKAGLMIGCRSSTSENAIDSFVAADIASAPVITGDQGSYSLAGQDASLKTTRILTAAQGSYSLSGQNVTLTYTQPGAYTLTASQGSYTITGSDGLAQRAMNALGGTYTLAGQAATFTLGTTQAYTIVATNGSYTLTGRSSRLLWSNAPIVLSSGHSISISISMGVS